MDNKKDKVFYFWFLITIALTFISIIIFLNYHENIKNQGFEICVNECEFDSTDDSKRICKLTCNTFNTETKEEFQFGG